MLLLTPMLFRNSFLIDRDQRKKQYVQSLGLIPFPKEGGHFKETIRSPNKVPAQERDGIERNLYTTIYYMMTLELRSQQLFAAHQ